MIHFDTFFVVDLLREASMGGVGPANSLLDSLPDEEMAISVFALCELLAGAGLAARSLQERQKVRAFCSNLRVVYPAGDFAATYGTLYATTRRSGRNSGVMDLLIATAAVRENAHLVTRDRTDFLDITDLGLITY